MELKGQRQGCLDSVSASAGVRADRPQLPAAAGARHKLLLTPEADLLQSYLQSHTEMLAKGGEQLQSSKAKEDSTQTGKKFLRLPTSYEGDKFK